MQKKTVVHAVSALALAATLGVPATAHAEDTLLVWASDAKHKAADFLAVVDFDKGAPTYGKVHIAAEANWDPKEYTLTWQPMFAALGPSGDMGYTFGHYDGKSKDSHGNPVTTSGRYITVWKRMPDGKWKVALDASANEPAGAGDCCALPKP